MALGSQVLSYMYPIMQARGIRYSIPAYQSVVDFMDACCLSYSDMLCYNPLGIVYTYYVYIL